MGVTSVPIAGGVVAEPVTVRRLTDQEGQKLQQIVCRDVLPSTWGRPQVPAERGRASPTVCRRPPPHARRDLLPRLLLRRQRPAAGRQPLPQGHRQHAGRAEADPSRSARPTLPGSTRSRPTSARGDNSPWPTPPSESHGADPGAVRLPNARHPDILAAQRRERARVRSEKGIHSGGRPSPPQLEHVGDSAVPGSGDQTAARFLAMTRSLPTPSGRRSPGSPVSVKPCRS